MGFCRRCGDIVVGVRCKCGGSAVAPVVKWNQEDLEENQDRWSRTYVTKEKSPTRPETYSVTQKTAPLRPLNTGNGSSNRFPRAHSNSQPVPGCLGSQVSAHIATVTAPRPLSPLKHATSASEDSNAEEGILPNPHGTELAKVYGSVLQPKETLASFTCALCSTPFPPDATIFPDPSTLSSSGVALTGERQSRFLCRPCFVVNGGSKGDCPSCHRPVLILKSEGGFVEASGKVWHRKCFYCDGCSKNIGDNPMMDLLGRPCCADCFDSCLKRPVGDSSSSPFNTPRRNNVSGGRSTQSREGSPALEELEQRLGIIRSKENTPNMEERGGRVHARIPNGHSSASILVDTSPMIDRLVSRARALSSSSMSPSSFPPGDYTPPARLITRNKSPDTYANSLGEGTPPPGRRSYARLKSPEPDIDSSSSPRQSYASPNHRSPASKPPTEEAIEEMKRRFLNQASPANAGPAANSSPTATPTRRSRSRHRASDASVVLADSSITHTTTTIPQRGSKIPVITHNSSSPGLRTSLSTSSLRSALRSNVTGPTQTSLQPDRTGESAFPLLRDRTGISEYPVRSDFTGETTYLPRQRTGTPTYLPRMATGETIRVVGRQRTGESLGTQHTGYGVFPQATGGTSLPLRSQKTGETIYEVQTHRTGDFQLRSNRTGEVELRYQRTGNTDYAKDRSGDAEVESLVGTFPATEQEDLIDLSSTVSSGSMSKIPVPTRISSSSTSSRPFGYGLRSSRSSTSLNNYDQSVPLTPDLVSDISDTMSTQSSGPSTPPSISPPLRKSRDSMSKGMKSTISVQFTGGPDRPRGSSELPHSLPPSNSKKVQIEITIPHQLPSSTRCAKCALPLFSTKHGGKFVTVPEEPTSAGVPPKTYHASCFTCNICHNVFEEREGGHAVFVRGEEGACHVRCAPPEKITLRRTSDTIPLSVKPQSPPQTPLSSTTRARSQTTSYTTSSRYEPPSATTATPIFPSRRFGASAACPGCNGAVSQMERGVVPGPQGSRWHAACLICGGKEAKGRRKEDGKAGCGKKLDSAAKTDAAGSVWCRECLLLLPSAQRQSSPVRSPIIPIPSGNRGGVTTQFTGTRSMVPQSTGTTTLARQFTGLGGLDPVLLRQLTGGGLSPTRQLSSSPTKLYDGPRGGAARHPRPKSVTGVRSTNGEGRGMFLVRQLTGGNTSFSGNDYGL